MSRFGAGDGLGLQERAAAAAAARAWAAVTPGSPSRWTVSGTQELGQCSAAPSMVRAGT